ncbi:MAG TPA: hypothetical protein VGO11_18460, partial [Chthoniobacteraceae bacterium]|nr:hypothetical protein [Chthoniobacteraceae bacterium]
MKPKRRLRSLWLSIGILSVLAAGERGEATGGYGGPGAYLEKGGHRVDEAPEFYWDVEVKRLARSFRPADAPAISPAVFPPQLPEGHAEGEEEPSVVRSRNLTGERDRADFAAALKEGRLKPPDAAAAQRQHDAARAVLVARSPEFPPLPAEFASEFADYHRGAHAFRQGEAHYAEARKAWEALLARPAAERHDRSVWAAFMLGKLALKQGSPEAAQWFQKTRALAREGFTDSLAMAADSYGWEARSEWKQGRPQKAAPLFLTQLALGDESAVISLKALIPDRDPIEGNLNYGPEQEEIEKWTPQQKKEAENKKRAGLRVMAADPLLRRLETVHILATETVATFADWGSPEPRVNRIGRWLGILKEAGVKQTDEAEYLGFAAYRLGDYAGAERWLDLAKGGSGIAHWLRAKLQRRAGKMEDAAKSMLLAWEALNEQAKYVGWQPVAPVKKEG